MEKNDDQLIFDWERQMIKEISQLIKKEIDEEKARLSHSMINFSTSYYESEYKKRVKKEVENYRIHHTLKILEEFGLDLKEFMNSPLYKSPRTSLMLEHIQGLIDGYDLSLISENNKTSDGVSISINVRKRINNGHPFNIDKMKCIYVNNSLIIEDDENRYVYYKDKHCLIYLNGNVILTNTIVHTEEEINESIARFHNEMERAINESNDKQQKSLDFAKTYWVK